MRRARQPEDRPTRDLCLQMSTEDAMQVVAESALSAPELFYRAMESKVLQRNILLSSRHGSMSAYFFARALLQVCDSPTTVAGPAFAHWTGPFQDATSEKLLPAMVFRRYQELAHHGNMMAMSTLHSWYKHGSARFGVA